MFSNLEQKAIDEKIEQLRKVKEEVLSAKELADLITKRRINWFLENKNLVLKKYQELPDEEKAYKMIIFDHMKVNPKHSHMVRVGKGKIKIKSNNFCPYLEACRKLGLDTKFVCKEIGEPSIQKFCKMINPRLKFSRNYQNIRPHCNFCEEYFELF